MNYTLTNTTIVAAAVEAVAAVVCADCAGEDGTMVSGGVG